MDQDQLKMVCHIFVMAGAMIAKWLSAATLDCAYASGRFRNPTIDIVPPTASTLVNGDSSFPKYSKTQLAKCTFSGGAYAGFGLQSISVVPSDVPSSPNAVLQLSLEMYFTVHVLHHMSGQDQVMPHTPVKDNFTAIIRPHQTPTQTWQTAKSV